MTYVFYFKSRANYRDTSTWAKDATIDEARQAARMFRNEGFAIVKNGKAVHMEWFVR